MNWISVKDRLPENDDPLALYWIYYGKEEQPVVDIAHFDTGQGAFTNMDTWWDYESRVTHWQPAEIPGPPSVL